MESTSLAAHEHSPIVEKLKTLLQGNEDMRIALIASLQAANKSAKENLNSDLYEAVNNEFKGNGWPVTIEGYFDYLDLYVRLVPNETNDPAYPNAWKSNGEENG